MDMSTLENFFASWKKNNLTSSENELLSALEAAHSPGRGPEAMRDTDEVLIDWLSKKSFLTASEKALVTDYRDAAMSCYSLSDFEYDGPIPLRGREEIIRDSMIINSDFARDEKLYTQEMRLGLLPTLMADEELEAAHRRLVARLGLKDFRPH